VPARRALSVLPLLGSSPIKEKKPVKRIRNLLRHAEFHVLLFAFGFALLNWPFLGIFRLKRPEVLLIYIYVLWAIGIFLLFLLSRIGTESAPADPDEKRKGHDA
jgi:hypothetical protein